MRPDFWKDFFRPIYGTIVFQPFALIWCRITDMDYLTMVGPFIIYSTIVFIPIYSFTNAFGAITAHDRRHMDSRYVSE